MKKNCFTCRFEPEWSGGARDCKRMPSFKVKRSLEYHCTMWKPKRKSEKVFTNKKPLGQSGMFLLRNSHGVFVVNVQEDMVFAFGVEDGSHLKSFSDQVEWFGPFHINDIMEL